MNVTVTCEREAPTGVASRLRAIAVNVEDLLIEHQQERIRLGEAIAVAIEAEMRHEGPRAQNVLRTCAGIARELSRGGPLLALNLAAAEALDSTAQDRPEQEQATARGGDVACLR